MASAPTPPATASTHAQSHLHEQQEQQQEQEQQEQQQQQQQQQKQLLSMSSRAPVAGPDSGPAPPYPIRLAGRVTRGFGRGSKDLGIPTANIPPDGLYQFPELETGVYYGVSALDWAARAQEDGEAVMPADAVGVGIFPCVLSIGFNPFYKNTMRSVEIHLLSPSASPPEAGPTTAATPTKETEEITNAAAPTSAPAGTDSQSGDVSRNTDKAAAAEHHHASHGRQPETATTTTTTTTTNNFSSSSTSSSATAPFYHLPDFYNTPLRLLILGHIRPERDYPSLAALVDDIQIDCHVARHSLERMGYAVYLAEGREEEGREGGPVDEARAWLRFSDR